MVWEQYLDWCSSSFMQLFTALPIGTKMKKRLNSALPKPTSHQMSDKYGYYLNQMAAETPHTHTLHFLRSYGAYKENKKIGKVI